MAAEAHVSEVVQFHPRTSDTRGSDPQPVAGGVVDITAGRPHSVGAAQCRNSPDHQWTAVVLSVSNPWLLECPICRKMTGHIPGARPETLNHWIPLTLEGVYRKLMPSGSGGQAGLGG